MMKSNLQSVWALDKPFSAGVEVTATMTNSDTYKDLIIYLLSFSHALTSTHFGKEIKLLQS